jgi:hypothetical protein
MGPPPFLVSLELDIAYRPGKLDRRSPAAGQAATGPGGPFHVDTYS